MLRRIVQPSGKQKQPLWRLAGLLSIGLVTGYFLLSRLELVMPIRQIPQVLCVPNCQPIKTGHVAIERDLALNSNMSLETLLVGDIDKEKVSLLVEKSQGRVTLFYNQEPIKSYEAVLGTAPQGDKRMEGDRKTPEGVFRIRDLYPHDEWSKFVWLDYPTPQSWRRHFRAKLSGEISPLATIGGQIGIHGTPSGLDSLIDEGENWTWGCISLKKKMLTRFMSLLRMAALLRLFLELRHDTIQLPVQLSTLSGLFFDWEVRLVRLV